MKASAAGLLMADEIAHLGRVLENPDRPFVAILGGAKVSDKLEVIENLIPRVDALLIGGAMAYTFLEARGVAVGKSLVEADLLDAARDIERRSKARQLRLELPVDHVVAPKLEAGAPAETLAVGDQRIGDRMGLDIGPETVKTYREVLAHGQDGDLERADGRLRDRRLRKWDDRGRQSCRGREGDDRHRRRRLDCRRRQSWRQRSDYAHLDRRRRVAGVPRRAQPAGRRGPEELSWFRS